MKTKIEKTETKSAFSFSDKIKELKTLFFILFVDIKNEIAILKEKIVKLDTPKNVLHVQTADNFSADYVSAIKENIGMEKLYKTIRTGKNLFSVNPCIAGILYHFCERIALKKASFPKNTKNLDAKILQSINCDLRNMQNFLCKDLIEMICKDNPKMKLTAKNSLVNFITVKDVEKGIIAFHTSAK